MKQSSHFISSFDITIELIVVGSPAFHDALRHETFWHEFVPGFRYDYGMNPVATWHITEAPNLDYDRTSRTIHATLSTVKKVVVIIEAVFEYYRQMQSHYTMHGSVIVQNDKAVALIGNMSGIGKTTLASYAAHNGWRWTVDEKFTLSGHDVIGGTSGVLYDQKSRVSSNHTAPEPSNQAYPLALVCQPIVTNETFLTKFEMSLDKARWTLYDEVTRDIRQVDGIVDISLPALQSFDSPSLTEKRVNVVDTLIHSVPIVYLRGPSHLILAEIESTLASLPTPQHTV